MNFISHKLRGKIIPKNNGVESFSVHMKNC